MIVARHFSGGIPIENERRVVGTLEKFERRFSRPSGQNHLDNLTQR